MLWGCSYVLESENQEDPVKWATQLTAIGEKKILGAGSAGEAEGYQRVCAAALRVACARAPIACTRQCVFVGGGGGGWGGK